MVSELDNFRALILNEYRNIDEDSHKDFFHYYWKERFQKICRGFIAERINPLSHTIFDFGKILQTEVSYFSEKLVSKEAQTFLEADLRCAMQEAILKIQTTRLGTLPNVSKIDIVIRKVDSDGKSQYIIEENLKFHPRV